MNLKSIKKDEKIEFHGIEIDREYRDTNLHSVTIRFSDGNFFTVARDGWSDMSILVKAPPKMIKKFVAKGREGGKHFEHKFLTFESAHALAHARHVADGIVEEIEEPEE